MNQWVDKGYAIQSDNKTVKFQEILLAHCDTCNSVTGEFTKAGRDAIHLASVSPLLMEMQQNLPSQNGSYTSFTWPGKDARKKVGIFSALYRDPEDLKS